MSVIEAVSLQDQIAEVRREVEMRRRVYVRLIDKGKMTTGDAARKSTVMAAVLTTLENIAHGER